MTPASGMRRVRAAALLLCGALIILLALQRFAAAPLETPQANLLVFLVQAAPAVAIAVSLLRVTLRCAFWTSMGSLLYVFHGVLQIFTVEGRLFGAVELLLALALFGAGFALSFQLRKAQNAH